MSSREYCVYIMSNAHNTVIYTGITNDLQRRVIEHKSGAGSSFTRRYNLTKLVYFESGDDVSIAIAREKQIKAGSRKKKIDLIESVNPEWKDLFEEYFR
jgi:putative endonuclease